MGFLANVILECAAGQKVIAGTRYLLQSEMLT